MLTSKSASGLDNDVTILADLLRTIFERTERRSNIEFDDDERSITELCDALITTTSETSALIIANKVLAKYSNLNDDEKLSFFQDVSTRMSIDPERVEKRSRIMKNCQLVKRIRIFQMLQSQADKS